MNWKETVLDMWLAKEPWSKIDCIVESEFTNLTPKQAHEKGRGYIRGTAEYKERHGVKVEKEPKPKKQEVCESREPVLVDEFWDGTRIIRFGLIGDTHINSKYTQLTHLHKFYDRCESLGVPTVYHVGDIDDGERMRPGHQYECYSQGADDHVAEIVRVYPQRKGITTKFITGNHDASMIKHCGYNIGPAIAQRREDMVYLGPDWAVVNLTPNCTLELRHPWDGSSYATSYKIQKIVESMEPDSKPNILAVGHYHKFGDFTPRNVQSFLTGAFQSQTPFTRGKGLSVEMGAWIIDAEVDKRGTVVELVTRKITFYKAIPDDYLNWR